MPGEDVTAYLDSVKRRPWVEHRISLATWLLLTQPVLDGLTTQDTQPEALNDPSWGWDALVRTWLVANKALPGWSRPLRPWVHGTIGITVIDTDQEWNLLGGMMDNCLKDGRSDFMRGLAKSHLGLLLRLSGSHHSVAFLEWEPVTVSGTPIAGPITGHEPGAWTLDQHYTSHNNAPHASHIALLDELIPMLNATITPAGLVTGASRAKALARLKRAGTTPSRVQALLDALDDGWHLPDPPPPPSFWSTRLSWNDDLFGDRTLGHRMILTMFVHTLAVLLLHGMDGIVSLNAGVVSFWDHVRKLVARLNRSMLMGAVGLTTSINRWMEHWWQQGRHDEDED